MESGWWRFELIAVGAVLVMGSCAAQSLPTTEGETLGGHRVVVAEAIRGQQAVLIAGFSKEGGDRCAEWSKAVHADPALHTVQVYQLVMLEKAPGFMRPMIKSGMRRRLSASEQERFVIFTQDEKLWRSYFGVDNDKDPWVVLIDAGGRVLWHGHGAEQYLEPLLKGALR